MQSMSTAMLLVALMMSAGLSGCFGEEEDGPLDSSDLTIAEIDSLEAGTWQKVTLTASKDLAVYIPYFIIDAGSNRAQNGTVLDMKAGDSTTLQWLLPPRNNESLLLIGEYGRNAWPMRASTQSWSDWVDNRNMGSAVQTTENLDPEGLWRWLTAGSDNGGDVAVKSMKATRPFRADLGADQGVGASDGWVDGRSVYEWVEFITDETPCDDTPLNPTCGPDLAEGYLDRWIGNGNGAYEHAIAYFEGVMKGYGLRTEVHRFQTGTLWAVNICGYKDGTMFPDEWLVFGGHFDIAPYATPPTAVIPGLEQQGYGTRTGAYDNTAGSSMVLTTAGALADFDARRTMVFCLWSSEEEGLWGSSAFAGDLPSGVTVSNYLNLDMAGINYPGDYALSVYLGPDGTGDVIDQPGMYHLAEWIGSDALDLAYQIERGEAEWAAVGENPLWQDQYEDMVAIYESPTARSDHDSFQQIGVATLGWNGVVDGYPCYHKTCDKLETMQGYMDTDDATGEANLVHSWDIVTWWAVFAFLHMDQVPVPNEL
jgi:hypothetical protein